MMIRPWLNPHGLCYPNPQKMRCCMDFVLLPHVSHLFLLETSWWNADSCCFKPHKNCWQNPHFYGAQGLVRWRTVVMFAGYVDPTSYRYIYHKNSLTKRQTKQVSQCESALSTMIFMNSPCLLCFNPWSSHQFLLSQQSTMKSLWKQWNLNQSAIDHPPIHPP